MTGASPVDELLAELRHDYQTARLLVVWLECIGGALSEGVISHDKAVELRADLPELRFGSDDFTERFCALVEEKHAAEQKHKQQRRRAA